MSYDVRTLMTEQEDASLANAMDMLNARNVYTCTHHDFIDAIGVVFNHVAKVFINAEEVDCKKTRQIKVQHASAILQRIFISQRGGGISKDDNLDSFVSFLITKIPGDWEFSAIDYVELVLAWHYPIIHINSQNSRVDKNGDITPWFFADVNVLSVAISCSRNSEQFMSFIRQSNDLSYTNISVNEERIKERIAEIRKKTPTFSDNMIAQEILPKSFRDDFISIVSYSFDFTIPLSTWLDINFPFTTCLSNVPAYATKNEFLSTIRSQM